MPPNYKVVSRDGPDHAPVFKVEVRVGELKSITGSSSSKRGAEQLAAEAMLLREGVWSKDENDD